MKVLAHFKEDQFESFIHQLIQLKRDYTKNVFGLEKSVFLFLDEVESFFKQVGNSTNESKISSLKTYLHTATRGVNPLSLEYVKMGKRKVVEASNYHCLSTSSTILEEELESIRSLIKQSEETLKQVILSALQSKVVSKEQLLLIKNIEDVEKLWNALVNGNEQIGIIDLKLKTEINRQDVILILEKIITSLNN